MFKDIFTQTINIRTSINYFFYNSKKMVVVDFCEMQILGIEGFRRQNLSYITVEIWETTRKGQSSHGAKVRDDGSFVALPDWNVESPGKYELSELAGAFFFKLNNKKNTFSKKKKKHKKIKSNCALFLFSGFQIQTSACATLCPRSAPPSSCQFCSSALTARCSRRSQPPPLPCQLTTPSLPRLRRRVEATLQYLAETKVMNKPLSFVGAFPTSKTEKAGRRIRSSLLQSPAVGAAFWWVTQSKLCAHICVFLIRNNWVDDVLAGFNCCLV